MLLIIKQIASETQELVLPRIHVEFSIQTTRKTCTEKGQWPPLNRCELPLGDPVCRRPGTGPSQVGICSARDEGEARMRKSPYRSFRGCLCPPFMCALQSAHIRPRSTRPNAIDAVQRQRWIEKPVGLPPESVSALVKSPSCKFNLFKYEMSRGLQVLSEC